MSAPRGVTARFSEYGSFIAGLKALRGAGIDEFRTYTPVPTLAEHEELLPRSGSPVRWYALVIGIAGGIGGFALCIMASRMYSQIVSGKAVVTLLPFGIIGFELAVLAAALATMASVFVYSRLFPQLLPDDHQPEFGLDAFGVTVRCADDERETVRKAFENAGADEVTSG